ncbi:MAG TPA: hypothetical protein DCL04_02810 [Synergistaceae bacterium]|nr:hypothetical protein [Synergistaceae bacterium]
MERPLALSLNVMGTSATLSEGPPATKSSMHTLKHVASGSSEHRRSRRTAKNPDMGSLTSTKILATAVAAKDAARR